MAEITFAGEQFRLVDRVSLMPLMRFAHVAERGVDSASLEGLAAQYELLRAVLAPEDWTRFQDAATASGATGDQLLDVTTEAMKLIAARPTETPSDSSDGRPRESGSSADDSPSQVIARLEREGRPSLALMVQQAQRSLVSA